MAGSILSSESDLNLDPTRIIELTEVPTAIGVKDQPPPEQRPHVGGRQRFGSIAIANADAGAAAFTNQAIDEAHRAVEELLVAKGLT